MYEFFVFFLNNKKEYLGSFLLKFVWDKEVIGK